MRCTLAALTLLLPLSLVRADTVTKTNGQTLKGTIVAESATDVTLQTNVGQLLVRTKVARSDIASLHKDARAQNRYCRIPLHGPVGETIKSDWIHTALVQAQTLGANTIVFDIDSPGGAIAEMAKIIEMLQKTKEQTPLKLVAYCHRTMSAAAMIALACDVIVMDTKGSIGAAVPWKFGPDGTPADVEAKFFSSYRAFCKAAAEHAGHNPLLPQGMMDMSLTLSMTTINGKPTVVEGTPKGSTPLKKPGEILCLSASEALATGLAAGLADSPQELQKTLNLKDFANAGDGPWAYMLARPAADKADSQRELAADRKDKLTALLEEVDTRIKIASDAKDAAQAKLQQLLKDYDAETKKVDPKLTPIDRTTRAQELYNTWKPRINEAQALVDKAIYELDDLTKSKTLIQKKMQDG